LAPSIAETVVARQGPSFVFQMPGSFACQIGFLRRIWQTDLLNFVKSLLIMTLHVSMRGFCAQGAEADA